MSPDAQLAVPASGPFQMQSWDASAACICWEKLTDGVHLPACPYPSATHAWEPMENGAASSHWRPAKTAQDAVRHAATWAGAVYGLGIPAMQVVDLSTGEPVWRDSSHYPAAGKPIEPPWQDEVYAAARAERAGEELSPVEPVPAPAAEPEPSELTLF